MKGSTAKKRNRWYIYYYVGKDEQGKWKRKWEGSWETKREAEKVLRSRLDDLENTFERKREKCSTADFLRHWLKVYCEPRLARNTVNGYQVNVEKHIIPYLGKIPLDRLQPTDIQALYSTLLNSGLSGTSVRYVHNNLHKALGFAVKTQLLSRNPADGVEPPRPDSFEGSTLKVDQIQALLTVCKGKDIFLPVLLSVTMGLRRGETLGLCWEDVDLSEKTITIRHSAGYDQGKMYLSSPKTKNSRRTLIIPDLVLKALENARSEQAALQEALGNSFNQTGLVCCRSDGTPYTTNALHHHFQNALAEANLPHMRFHDLRHTNATLMLRNAVPAKVVSAMLGHSSIGITMDVYAHVLTEMQEQAVYVMDSLLKP